jgi:preprotein translocase subunit SecD
MRRNKLNIVVIVAFILIIGAAFFYVYPFDTSINLGLDLRGGTQIILKATQAEDQEDPEALPADAIDKAMLIIMDRVDRLGISEPLITRDYADNIVIQLPGVDDPDRAIDVIGQTAQLEFRVVESYDPVEDEYDLGPVLFTGSSLSKSNAGYDSTGSIVVFLSFTSDGARIFEEVTAQNIGRQLAIVLDGEVKSAPVIRAAISGEKLS